MKHLPSFLLGLASCAFVTSTIVAATSPRQDAAQSPAAAQQPAGGSAAGDGAADPALADKSYPLFNDMCGACHDSDRIVSRRRTKAEWQDIITQMIDKGATGSEKDFETVFSFVRRFYGKLFINTANAEEITTTLGLSSKDADAILAYRKANGNFADFDALKKVPDLDVKTLDAHKDAIAF